MSNQYCSENPFTPINLLIEQVDIKGQYIQLAAPIQLSGQLNIAELLTQYPINIESQEYIEKLRAIAIKFLKYYALNEKRNFII